MDNVNLKDVLLDTLTKYYENLLNTDTKFNTTIREINDVLLSRASKGKNQATFIFNFDVFNEENRNLVIHMSEYNITLPYISDFKSFNKVKTYYSKIENFNVEVTQKTNISFKNLIELHLSW